MNVIFFIDLLYPHKKYYNLDPLMRQIDSVSHIFWKWKMETEMERKRNGKAKEMERKSKGNGTEKERKWNGNGTELERNGNGTVTVR